MPDQETTEKAKEDLREGKSPSTAAGEFVHEEIEHVREGKHGASSPQQAIAIGLSKARRAGIPLKPPSKESSSASPEVRERAERDYEKGQSGEGKKPSPRRSEARKKALKKEPKSTASRAALSKQTRTAAKKRSAGSRKAAAQKAVHTKGSAGRKQAAKKAARTRARSH
ncbi:MAG: DNA-binding protein [Acidobacteriaceae bacterium]